MTAWAEFGWGLVFGAAMAMVAFDCRDLAWRIHGFMADTVGVDRLLTPTVVRVVCGVPAVASPASGTFGPAGSE
ncbi:hypothetical protein [Streptomyces massasporeus]|uniref:hypothetical protein n=1 Tax=Streptomyces massasporeus TaxID=67324 RepID=UPI0036BAEA34